MRTIREIEKIVQSELFTISLPEIVAAIKPLLVTPTMHLRNWDYGQPGEAYHCWTVLEHPESDTAIVYSDDGFGPTCPWGLVGLSASDKWFGMDSGWFRTLEDAFCDSFAVSDLPIWNLVRHDPDGSHSVVETTLSLDNACEKANSFNSRRQKPTDGPFCFVELRR